MTTKTSVKKLSPKKSLKKSPKVSRSPKKKASITEDFQKMLKNPFDMTEMTKVRKSSEETTIHLMFRLGFTVVFFLALIVAILIFISFLIPSYLSKWGKNKETPSSI